MQFCVFIHLSNVCEHDLSIFEVLCNVSTKLMNKNTWWIEWERMGTALEKAQAQSVQICPKHKLIECWQTMTNMLLNHAKSMKTNAVLPGLGKSGLTLYRSSHQGSSCDPANPACLQPSLCFGQATASLILTRVIRATYMVGATKRTRWRNGRPRRSQVLRWQCP